MNYASALYNILSLSLWAITIYDFNNYAPTIEKTWN